MKKTLLIVAVTGLAGCGRYRDFRLPELSPPESGRYVWSAHPDPVLARGAPGEWDAVDTLNPSIVVRNGVFYNFYSGYDGKTWHTGLATSSNGIQWQRGARILSPNASTWEGSYIAANGAALWFQDEWWYWYQAGDPPRLGVARSSDGRTFHKLKDPVLDFGPRGSWDERAIGDPYILRVGDDLYLYYLGEDRARRQRLGVATSSDGLIWWKHKRGPLLELGEPRAMDENGLGEPAVWSAHGWYWMLYTGRARDEVRRLGLARSRDGIRWERLDTVLSGEANWNGKVLCDPTVDVQGNRVRVWFGGGDVAHPAENVHGQIGYGELEYRP